MPKSHDNFLADAIGPKDKQISYFDGFRFGLGFFLSGLLVSLIIGGIAWGVIAAFGVR
jgi:hypothetical protein